jgi:putative membrane protein
MVAHPFFSDEARARARDAVVDVESHTSAELVIAVRAESGSYRDADYLSGALLALALLLVLLFHPYPFETLLWPLELAAAFALGALLCSRVPPLRRALVSRARRREAAQVRARAAFVDMGISRTRGRNGVLVFVSLFEHAVEVVPDVGVDVKALGEGWDEALAAMRAAVAPREDFGALLAAVKRLGPVLGATMPRAEDDVNELPDQMETAQ